MTCTCFSFCWECEFQWISVDFKLILWQLWSMYCKRGPLPATVTNEGVYGFPTKNEIILLVTGGGLVPKYTAVMKLWWSSYPPRCIFSFISWNTQKTSLYNNYHNHHLLILVQWLQFLSCAKNPNLYPIQSIYGRFTFTLGFQPPLKQWVLIYPPLFT